MPEFISKYWIPLIILSVGLVASIATFIAIKNDSNGLRNVVKYWTSAVLLVAGVLIAIVTFVASKQDSDQKDRIEKLGEVSKELGQLNELLGSKNIELGNININLSATNQTIVRNIDSLSQEHVKLSSESQKIIKSNLEISEHSKTLAQQNQELSRQLFTLSEYIRDLNTGGNSFPRLDHNSCMIYKKGVQSNGDLMHLTFTIRNVGDFALDNLRIKGYKNEKYLETDPVVLWTEISSSGLNIHSRFPRLNNTMQGFFNTQSNAEISDEIDVFKPAQSIALPYLRIQKEFEYLGLNIFVESKRQDWILLVRLYRPKNSTDPLVYQACRTLKMTGSGLEEVAYDIDGQFPRNSDGEVEWFKSKMPEVWFKK